MNLAAHTLYLHGFASSPESTKARFFGEHLNKLGLRFSNKLGLRFSNKLGLRFSVPDLTDGDFERLTISGQLSTLERVAENKPVTLIGSSLGGYIAALYAAKHPEVEKLILLAPAFRFHELWRNQLGPENVAAWRQNGTIQVFHYGLGRETPLRYEFFEDSSRFDPSPDFSQPALLFHGNFDPVVPVAYSLGFAEHHKNVRVITLDSGHELTDVLDVIWGESRNFLLDS